MDFDKLIEESGQRQAVEDKSALDNEGSKMGEGANTAAHLSPRGYVIKSVLYSKEQADKSHTSSENPHDHVERVRDIERFPWAEVEDLDEGDGPFQNARIRMAQSYMSHEDAADLFHVSDIIFEDLDMFFELREEDITYDDFKPSNIGYFQDDDISDGGIPVAKAIDITDGARKAWTEEDLSYQRFSDIMDVYIRGTPDEDGLTDTYTVSIPEAEEHLMSYLGIESINITGDPYKDLNQVPDETQQTVEDSLSY